MLIQERGLLVERVAEPVLASTRDGEFAGVLWKPTSRDRHNRAPQDVEMLCQRQDDTRPPRRVG